PGAGGEIASREKRFEAAQEFGVDRERVREGAVLRTGLLDDHLAVALENRGGDLADTVVNQRFDRAGAGQNLRPRLTHTGGTKRIGAPGPAERGLRPLTALQQRPVRPRGLERSLGEEAIDALDNRPGQSSSTRQGQLEWSPHIHRCRY